MRKILTGILLSACSLYVSAQNNFTDKTSLHFETRFDYQMERVKGDEVCEKSGFKGKYFNLILSGNLNSSISYHYRQRLNKYSKDATFFDATDWLYLYFKLSSKWTLSAGKQVVAIGGFEYDRAPIDIYWASEYWHNIPCYRWGGSVTYSLTGNDQLLFQVCMSPFDPNSENLYAFNLMWVGNHGAFTAFYSANLMEYLPGKYISYLALGNQLKIGKARLQFDFMNRATNEHAYFFKNCSVIGELTYSLSKYCNVFGKVSYDVNKTRSASDLCVLPGTELTRVGGGVECFPLKGDKNLRFHASGCYTFGKNGNPNGSLADDQAFFNVGLTWRVDLLSAFAKAVKSQF